eukprot:1453419-Amphidinium_carterae.1
MALPALDMNHEATSDTFESPAMPAQQRITNKRAFVSTWLNMGSVSRVPLVRTHMMVKGSRKNKNVRELNHPRVEPTRTHLGVRQDHQ